MTLPTFDGEKDKTLGRVMLAAVDGPDGIRTRISSNAFGSKTMLRTRNRMPEFTTVRAKGTQTLPGGVRCLRPWFAVRGVVSIPTRWKSWTQNIVWWGRCTQFRISPQDGTYRRRTPRIGATRLF